VGIILTFIKALAEYEKLSHEVVATEESILETLFGNNPKAEVLLVRGQSKQATKGQLKIGHFRAKNL